VHYGGFSFAAGHRGELSELSAPVDLAGKGMAAVDEPLAYYSQPRLGSTLQLGVAVRPGGLAALFLDLGPVQAPRFQLGAPLCGSGNVYTSLQVSVPVAAVAPPNALLPLPNAPSLSGHTLVLQGLTLTAASCWHLTDALHVQL
jgi:hypothetical protein